MADQSATARCFTYCYMLEPRSRSFVRSFDKTRVLACVVFGLFGLIRSALRAMAAVDPCNRGGCRNKAQPALKKKPKKHHHHGQHHG